MGKMSVPGQDLLRLCGTMTPEEADELLEAIEEDWTLRPVNYLQYYHLEQYLFEEVRPRFHAQHSLGAFDFFSIVVWKANRAKSKIARMLLKKAEASDKGYLEPIIRRLTKSLYKAGDHRERLRLLLCDWKFRLAMASAILTVLWPEDFTVFDVRVCKEVAGFQGLGGCKDFNHVWEQYGDYRNAVRNAGPGFLSLREKDRYLWARSAAQQLEDDIASRFDKASDIRDDEDDAIED